MPAKAGIQSFAKELGPRFRGDERRIELTEDPNAAQVP
jgi:hypothetical protein